ncbi:putative Glycogen recognition site of AMP-activated protein kinase [Blattamonas nauphoetae]|uniref:Glycogen recognition site of AMP-activated protein kinase n=1 Tax=Blattamonas nauphoetae TaxID=2049346 RepID=A0ABQ9X692_9EUKA|nr:putative Glycogen recognition site of AMP-activated protein kinase [Blattamonas nauphoetae]
MASVKGLSAVDRNRLAENVPSPYQDGVIQGKRLVEAHDFGLFQVPFPNPQNTSSVEICGSWDEWAEKLPLRRNKGLNGWHCTLKLHPGKYKAKFCVNGEHWVVTNMLPIVSDGGGNNNNIITIESTADVDTASAGIGTDIPSHSTKSPVISPQSSDENPPPIYKMYFCERERAGQEFIRGELQDQIRQEAAKSRQESGRVSNQEDQHKQTPESAPSPKGMCAGSCVLM